MSDSNGDIKIPPLSMVTVQIMQYDPLGPEASSHALENIISPDKGVSAEILRVSNSSFYGRSGSVKTLRDAITLLGGKAVKNLTVLLATKAMAGALKGETYKKYLQEFPIASALLAQDLAQQAGKNQLREEVFLGALLHKIGMTSLALTHPRDYQFTLNEAEKEGLDLAAEERKNYGRDHVDVAGEIAERWKLPAGLHQILTRHDFAADDISQVSDQVRLTALAGLTAREMMGLLLPMEELERKARLAHHYGLEGAIEKMDAKYYQNLQEHPFFQQAMGD